MPLPVCAAPRMSRPLSAGGSDLRWIVVRVLKCALCRPVAVCVVSGSWENSVAWRSCGGWLAVVLCGGGRTYEFRNPLFEGCEFLVVALPLQTLYRLLERSRALLRESHCRHLGGFGGGGLGGEPSGSWRWRKNS